VIRDRDAIYGLDFRERVKHMGIEEVIIAPRSPWQNPFVERLVGSMRRECLDHVIVFNEAHLVRILTSCLAYYHEARTHFSLDRNAPSPRKVQPPSLGRIIAISQVGGLHHRYTRAASDGDTLCPRRSVTRENSALFLQKPPIRSPSRRRSGWRARHLPTHPGHPHRRNRAG
jgi:hypothetical protein